MRKSILTRLNQIKKSIIRQLQSMHRNIFCVRVSDKWWKQTCLWFVTSCLFFPHTYGDTLRKYFRWQHSRNTIMRCPRLRRSDVIASTESVYWHFFAYMCTYVYDIVNICIHLLIHIDNNFNRSRRGPKRKKV